MEDLVLINEVSCGRRHFRAAQPDVGRYDYAPRLPARGCAPRRRCGRRRLPGLVQDLAGRAPPHSAARSRQAAAKIDDFIAAMATETGSTAGWAHSNVEFADMLREAASLTTQITRDHPLQPAGSMAMAVRQAAGVALSVAP
jgi:hypothetical protein